MAITNHERVGKALELLKTGLGPFVEREFKAKYGSGWASSPSICEAGKRHCVAVRSENKLVFVGLGYRALAAANGLYQQIFCSDNPSFANQLDGFASKAPFSRPMPNGSLWSRRLPGRQLHRAPSDLATHRTASTCPALR